ncbi:MAG: GNAT family N-acetyltransferase, partial [Pseudomonadota bacterium]
MTHSTSSSPFLFKFLTTESQSLLTAEIFFQDQLLGTLNCHGVHAYVRLTPSAAEYRVQDLIAALETELRQHPIRDVQVTLEARDAVWSLQGYQEVSKNTWYKLLLNQADIRLEALHAGHFDQILAWFRTDHVKRFYSVHSYTQEETLERYRYQLELPHIQGFIVYYQERPVGYVQVSPLRSHPWPGQDFPAHMVQDAGSLEMFIGDEAALAQGIGTLMLNVFLEQAVWPKYAYAALDPWLYNERAIKFYERNGFMRHKIIWSIFTGRDSVPVQLMYLKRPLEATAFQSKYFHWAPLALGHLNAFQELLDSKTLWETGRTIHRPLPPGLAKTLLNEWLIEHQSQRAFSYLLRSEKKDLLGCVR